MVDSTRPRWLRIFSSHAMGMKALVSVDFWSRSVIPDDSRQFWRMFFASDGRAQTRPLHVPVYLDAVQASSYLATLREQYRQIRRWSYGVIDFPYIMGRNLESNRVPFFSKVVQTVRQLSQFHLWATVPLTVMCLRPVVTTLEPIVVDESGRLFGRLVVAVDVGTAVITLLSLVLSVGIALALLPPRPERHSVLTWPKMALEWLLLPLVLPLFLCLPAIDAQVRLLSARYLGFRVTTKDRRHSGHEIR